MKKIDIGQFTNTVANVGVILGIVFLGLELQQNNEFAAESERAARYQAALGVYELALNNPDLARINRKARKNEELTDDEFSTFAVFFTRVWLGLQQTIDRTNEADRATFVRFHRRTFEQNPVLRELWQRDRELYDPNFVAFMEQEIVGNAATE